MPPNFQYRRKIDKLSHLLFPSFSCGRSQWIEENLFKQGSAAVALSGTQAFPQSKSTPKQKRRVCLIGCGWYGKIDLFRMLQVEDVEVVALCDVDSKMLEEAADRVAARQVSGNRPQTYEDFRKLLSEVDVDVALIATPDHWHALPMIAACQNGIDVYVQKPIGIDVVECESMLAAARKYNRVVQVGMQRRSTPHLIEANETNRRCRSSGRRWIGRSLLLLSH